MFHMERRPLNLSAARNVARDNLVTTYLGLARGAPGCQITVDPSMITCISDPEISFGNFSLRFNGGDGQADSIAFRLAGYGHESPQYRVLLTTVDRPPTLSSSLKRQGFEMVGRLSVMAAEGFPVEWRAQLDLIPARAMADRRRLSEFMVRHFSTRREPFQREILTECTAGSPHQLWYLGQRDLEGGVMLSESPGGLGLYNLCVAPRHQSQGIGSALVRACGAMATSEGRMLVLQSSSALVPWYRRLGFVEVGSLETYRPVVAG